MKITNRKITALLRSIEVVPSPIWQDKVACELKQHVNSEQSLNISSNHQQGSAMDRLKIWKKFSYALAGLAAAVILMVGGLAWADTSAPGDFLYPVDRSWEKVQIAWAELRGDLAAANLYLDLADERLDELDKVTGEDARVAHGLMAIAYADAGQDVLVERLLADYQTAIDKATAKLAKLQAQGPDADTVSERIANATLRHAEKMLEVYDRVPLQAKDNIEKAMIAGAQGHNEALQNISEDKQLQVRNQLQNQTVKVDEQLTEQGMPQIRFGQDADQGPGEPTKTNQQNKAGEQTKNQGEQTQLNQEQEQEQNQNQGETVNREQEQNSENGQAQQQSDLTQIRTQTRTQSDDSEPEQPGEMNQTQTIDNTNDNGEQQGEMMQNGDQDQTGQQGEPDQTGSQTQADDQGNDTDSGNNSPKGR